MEPRFFFHFFLHLDANIQARRLREAPILWSRGSSTRRAPSRRRSTTSKQPPPDDRPEPQGPNARGRGRRGRPIRAAKSAPTPTRGNLGPCGTVSVLSPLHRPQTDLRDPVAPRLGTGDLEKNIVFQDICRYPGIRPTSPPGVRRPAAAPFLRRPLSRHSSLKLLEISTHLSFECLSVDREF